ncbi:MAG: sugar ABC transporter permease [Proteobacteria bacterium]|nr:sugar ABC transporter permease [Pseudomonadota bacterium]
MQKMTRMEMKENVWGYIFILPWIIGFLWFFLGPFVSAIYLSFTRYTLVKAPIWVGFKNYIKLFTDDALFPKALVVTFKYAAMSVPLSLISSLMIAVLLNQKIKAMPVFRTIYYLPAVLPALSVWLLWAWLFDPTFGLFNSMLQVVGIKGPNWLGSTSWVLPSIVLMGLWGIGRSTIIYLAALQGVPQELYDAVEVDGASVLRRFWSITLPMISPAIFFNLIMGVIGTFQVFGAAYTMTGGGPNNASLFYQLYLYRKAFEDFRMGYASSLAWIIFFIILFFTLLILKGSPMWVYYEGMKKTKGR